MPPWRHPVARRYEAVARAYLLARWSRQPLARDGPGGLRGDLGRDVAMKVLLPHHARNAAMVRRFVEEAQIAGQLQHPGILQVYELGLQSDRRPCFTMRLIKGRTLQELLDTRRGPADDRRRVLVVFEQVCQAIAYAHAPGVIHRDLKPGNVMVGSFGEVQVVDWGLARVIGDAAAGARPGDTVIETTRPESEGSLSGSVMGTPAYMPPEQARGELDRLDERCDVFALGAILCEILTGRPPYEGPDALSQAREGRLDAARRRIDAAEAGPELRALVRSCLAPLERRPRHAGLVASALSSYPSSVEERARAADLAAAEARATAELMDEWMTGEHDKPIRYLQRIIDEDSFVEEIHDLAMGSGETKVFELSARRRRAG